MSFVEQGNFFRGTRELRSKNDGNKGNLGEQRKSFFKILIFGGEQSNLFQGNRYSPGNASVFRFSFC